MSDITIDARFLSYLRQAARKHTFDWSRVCEAVTQEFAHDDAPALNLATKQVLDCLTPTVCRQVFAEDYSVLSAFREQQQDSAPALPVPAPLANTTVTTFESIRTQLDELSLEEMAEFLEKQEVELTRRKELVFDRVLASLGTPSDEALAEINDEATSAFKEGTKAREWAKQKKEEDAKRAIEQEQLQLERDRLKRRFDVDSIGMK
jgi:hypothetical protein